MRKYLCMLLALMLLGGMALAETDAPATGEPETEIVAVEETEDAVEEAEEPEETPAPAEEMAEDGVIYCLSDAAGTGWLYIQNWSTDCADLDALKELIDRTTQLQTSGIYDFNGTDFVVYDLVEGDVSCCAVLMDGKALNLVFTPQSDADFMAVSAQILNTFEIL